MSKADEYKDRATNAASPSKRAYWEGRARREEGVAEPGSKARYLRKHPPNVGAKKRRTKAVVRQREKRVVSVLLKSRPLWSLCEAYSWTHNDLALFVTVEGDYGEDESDLQTMVECARRLYVDERARLVAAGRIPKRNES